MIPTASKIRGRDAAVKWRRQLGVVVFTNGVFDLIHPGHVGLLEDARAMGDALMVGLNTDASVRRLEKGSGRPHMSEDARARTLAALEAVDCVVLFEEDTPIELITAVVPDVLVKGADYAPDDIVGADIVVNAGGRVERVPLVEEYSTTALVERIRATS